MSLESFPETIYLLTYLRPFEPSTHVQGIIPESLRVGVCVYVSALLGELHFLLLLEDRSEQGLPCEVAFPKGVTEGGDSFGEVRGATGLLD